MSLDSREFRDAMGRFPTGICVITANPQGFAPFGMTVNSFASVSLDPPLVLWSLRNDSECFAAFEKADKYGVNILAADQAELSTQYSKKDNHTLDSAHYTMGRHGTPLLRGAVTSFECDIWQRYDGGDHVILVGKVETMQNNPVDSPLVFFSGKYRELR